MTRWALVLGLGLLASVTAQEAPKSEFLPLAVGTVWTYRAGEKTVLLKVTKHEKIDGISCALLESSIDGKVAGAEHVAVGKDGLYRHTAQGQKVEPPVCFLRVPAKVGEKWSFDARIGVESLQGSSTLDEAEVTVPAGTFRTVVVKTRIQRDQAAIDISNFYAAGIGMVKQVQSFGGKEVLLELVKYDAAK